MRFPQPRSFFTRALQRVVGVVLLISIAVPTVALAQQAPRTTATQQQQQQQQLDLRVALQLVADGLTSPVAILEPPDGSRRRFIVDRVGLVYVLTPTGTMLEQPFLDLSEQVVDLRQNFDERGLLGMAFHPQFARNGRFFVYYSAPLRPGAPNDFDHTAYLSEFRVSRTNPNRADPNSELILLAVDQPQFNHNGGTIAFGPGDGYLYLSLGDGGNAGDIGLGHVADWYRANEGGNGQDIAQNLLGSILRLDVDRGDRYAIPPDNPFVGTGALPEIYAYGFRNPYRFSFDQRGTHALIAGDAGQNLWEEVDVVVRGGNYGWNVKEGTHCFDAANPNEPPQNCPGTTPDGQPLLNPVIEYPNAKQRGGVGLAVVGGHVYRGRDLPQFYGYYLFGDWSRSFEQPDGSLFIAQPQARGMWPAGELRVANGTNGRLGHYLLGFGQDLLGEMYVLTTDTTGPTGNTGRVFRLVQPGQPRQEIPPPVSAQAQTLQELRNQFQQQMQQLRNQFISQVGALQEQIEQLGEAQALQAQQSQQRAQGTQGAQGTQPSTQQLQQLQQQVAALQQQLQAQQQETQQLRQQLQRQQTMLSQQSQPPAQQPAQQQNRQIQATPTPVGGPGRQAQTGAAAQAEPEQVVMQNISYQPQRLTVDPGTTVQWINRDGVAHTVTSGTPQNPTNRFQSGTMQQGQQYSFTFDEPGTYQYFCRLHPAQMQAVIEVRR